MSSVEIQSTPNPNARKFVLPMVAFDGPLSFADVDTAAAHPLAARLFALGAIYNVFMVKNFITVNKLPAADWAPLAEQVRLLIDVGNDFVTAESEFRVNNLPANPKR